MESTSFHTFAVIVLCLGACLCMIWSFVSQWDKDKYIYRKLKGFGDQDFFILRRTARCFARMMNHRDQSYTVEAVAKKESASPWDLHYHFDCFFKEGVLTRTIDESEPEPKYLYQLTDKGYRALYDIREDLEEFGPKRFTLRSLFRNNRITITTRPQPV